MTERREQTAPLYENLDTAYVRLAALVRYLEGRSFTGVVRVELEEYGGEIVLRAGEQTTAREVNHLTGATTEGEAALQRLFVRAGEPGGLISVYEGEAEASATASAARRADRAMGEDETDADLTPEELERRELLRLSGELIECVERAVLVAGGDFAAALHAARLSLTEDFPFLDPLTRRFEYEEGVVRLDARPSARLYVSGINEALRRVVERVAGVEQKIGVRKDVVRELSSLLRRRQSALARFKFTPQQLERIAGMKLL
ncbi:MAG TPA: hypothetical protein VGV59_00710 [Pyrinomonadaceae bacterium]|nr:hypothetical protein [Pyrinomonadaceae bacterium]